MWTGSVRAVDSRLNLQGRVRRWDRHIVTFVTWGPVCESVWHRKRSRDVSIFWSFVATQTLLGYRFWSEAGTECKSGRWFHVQCHPDAACGTWGFIDQGQRNGNNQIKLGYLSPNWSIRLSFVYSYRWMAKNMMPVTFGATIRSWAMSIVSFVCRKRTFCLDLSWWAKTPRRKISRTKPYVTSSSTSS